VREVHPGARAEFEDVSRNVAEQPLPHLAHPGLLASPGHAVVHRREEFVAKAHEKPKKPHPLLEIHRAADSANAVAESNESNNGKTVTFVKK
jgi:hypothetical protein